MLFFLRHKQYRCTADALNVLCREACFLTKKKILAIAQKEGEINAKKEKSKSDNKCKPFQLRPVQNTPIKKKKLCEMNVSDVRCTHTSLERNNR